MCYYNKIDNWEACLNQTIVSTSTLTVWPQLAINLDVLFKVSFITTIPLVINNKFEKYLCCDVLYYLR